jgi:ABC-type antimicrobial peptide transport system permease subunit
METLKEILSPYGTEVDFTLDRLAAFNQVSNTYLTVFMTLGGFGMLIGVLGLAFILLRNYNLRKKEFALLMSTGYTPRKIRGLVLREHLAILIAGITAGTLPAVIATLPSITSGTDIPLLMLSIMIAAIFFTGWIALLISSRSMLKGNLINNIRSN